MSTLFERLRVDHVNMRDLLTVLAALVGRLHQDAADVDYQVMLDIFDYFTGFPDAVHHPVEDQLFDELLRRSPDLAAEIAELRCEHEANARDGAAIHRDLQGICAGQLVSRQRLIEMTEAYIARQMVHMDKEEGRILPLARARIRDAEWDAFEERHKDAIDPLFGPTIRETFKRLHDYVMDTTAS